MSQILRENFLQSLVHVLWQQKVKLTFTLFYSKHQWYDMYISLMLNGDYFEYLVFQLFKPIKNIFHVIKTIYTCIFKNYDVAIWTSFLPGNSDLYNFLTLSWYPWYQFDNTCVIFCTIWPFENLISLKTRNSKIFVMMQWYRKPNWSLEWNVNSNNTD